MPDGVSGALIKDTVAKAAELNLCFLHEQNQTRQVPFTLTPVPVEASVISRLEVVATLLGRLTQALADRSDLLQSVHAPLAAGDPFFAEMLSMHHELHREPSRVLRVPLLLQRSDFMLDQQLGPQLVECNSIAAGMAPFGEQVHHLHTWLREHWPTEFAQFHTKKNGELLRNPATENMARAIAYTAQKIAGSAKSEQAPAFLMVVQENEDNVFDQQLLEQALQHLGVRTYRRTFRQLHQQLSTGPGDSLQLESCGTIHVVYLRAGYQYRDYLATDLDSRRCCDALRATRLFIERHRVAVNATVAQQLATSKRMQMQLANDNGELLAELGFDTFERELLQAVFAPMRAIDANTARQLREEASTGHWVLKNQGEGGGHCLFDADIVQRLDSLKPDQYDAWTLMQRLYPVGREQATLLVRDGQAQQVQGLVSEIGLFTAHLGAEALPTGEDRLGHIGYLVRSKPADVSEGGIHSGFGALDSLFVLS